MKALQSIIAPVVEVTTKKLGSFTAITNEAHEEKAMVTVAHVFIALVTPGENLTYQFCISITSPDHKF